MELANICNGHIEQDRLTYLKSLDLRYERYRVRKGNLVLSKSVAPFMSAVVEFDENQILTPSADFKSPHFV